MTALPSFDEHYRPQLQANLDQNVVDFMEQKLNQAREINDVNEAERLLEEACDQCVERVKVQVTEIKTSVRQRGANFTSPEDRERYRILVQGATAGIHATQELFNTIFTRIGNLVETVVDGIRNGFAWMTNVISDAFTSIRSLFNN